MMSRPHFKITRHEFQNVKMAFRGRADTNSQAVIRKLMFQTTRVVVASSSQSSNSKSWAWETEETDRPSLENISHWVKSLHFVQKCPINQAILKLFVYQFQLFVYQFLLFVYHCQQLVQYCQLFAYISCGHCICYGWKQFWHFFD